MRVFWICFLLGFLLAGCSHDIGDCAAYVDSLQGIRQILQASLGMSILSLYPSIWGIIVVRKILM